MDIQQVNGADLTDPHPVTNQVISPAMEGNFLSEFPLTTSIHELLFRVTTDQSVFWVGAAIPENTIDFTRAQIFFHPTVVQAGNVVAADADYPEFKGGWSGRLQRYVAMQGCQLAGSRLLPLLIPFTSMAALQGGSLNMFAADPVGLLTTVLAAAQAEVRPSPFDPEIAAIGVSSFSSGIGAMRQFISAMSPSGLVLEVTDFDSPFIIAEPKALTVSPGASSRCYTQVAVPNQPPGWVTLPPASFANLTSFGGVPHSCIGFMMYYTAMLTSAIL